MPGMRVSSTLALATGMLALTSCAPEAGPSAPPDQNAAAATGEARLAGSDLVLRAADGMSVHARPLNGPRPRATILLFHQAGAGADEYAAIAPRLNALGYTTLALDQRSGGDRFGRNRTVAAAGKSTEFLAAEPDLEAAFAWAKDRGLPVIVWGSSYSAALVFRLAARHPGEVAAVLAFSPGEYFDRPDAVRRAASTVNAPIFVAAASDPAERAAARAILDAAPSSKKVSHLPERGGVHGSSVLDPGRAPSGSNDAWRAVEAFLADVPLNTAASGAKPL